MSKKNTTVIDLAKELRKKHKKFKKDNLSNIIYDIFDEMTNCLSRGENIAIHNLGKLKITKSNHKLRYCKHSDSYNKITFACSTVAAKKISEAVMKRQELQRLRGDKLTKQV